MRISKQKKDDPEFLEVEKAFLKIQEKLKPLIFEYELHLFINGLFLYFSHILYFCGGKDEEKIKKVAVDLVKNITKNAINLIDEKEE